MIFQVMFYLFFWVLTQFTLPGKCSFLWSGLQYDLRENGYLVTVRPCFCTSCLSNWYWNSWSSQLGKIMNGFPRNFQNCEHYPTQNNPSFILLYLATKVSSVFRTNSYHLVLVANQDEDQESVWFWRHLTNNLQRGILTLRPGSFVL